MAQTGERTVMFTVPGQRAVLVCQLGRFAGRRFELAAGTFTIGRSPECTLCLADDQGASRVHTKIWLENDAWFVADNDSRNGTFLNQKAVKHSQLQDGDVVRVSGCELRFSTDAEMSAEQAPAAKSAFSKTTLQRAPNAMTMSMPAMRGPNSGPELSGPKTGSGIRPAAAPTTSSGGQRAVRESPPPPPELQDPTPLTQGSMPALASTMTATQKKPANPMVIVGAITGGVVLAGVLVVGLAVAWKKKPTGLIVADPLPPPVVVVAPPQVTPPTVAVVDKEPPKDPEPIKVIEDKPEPKKEPQKDPTPVASILRPPPPPPPTKKDPPPPTKTEPKKEEPPAPPPPPMFSNVEWIAATVDSGAVDVVRSKSKGTIASVVAKDGDTVSAGQVVIAFAGGVDGPATVVASAAGKLEGLRVKTGDAVQKGVMLFKLVDAGGGKKVRAVLPPNVLPKARVGASVELKKKKGGTVQGRIIRISGAAIVVDPGDLDATLVEGLRIP